MVNEGEDGKGNENQMMPPPQNNLEVYEDFCLSETQSGKLRIWLIERLLERKDLTKQQRRSLMTRRNTARYRERERRKAIKESLYSCTIPESELMVGVNLNYPNLRLASKKRRSHFPTPKAADTQQASSLHKK